MKRRIVVSIALLLSSLVVFLFGTSAQVQAQNQTDGNGKAAVIMACALSRGTDQAGREFFLSFVTLYDRSPNAPELPDEFRAPTTEDRQVCADAIAFLLQENFEIADVEGTASFEPLYTFVRPPRH